MERLLCILSSLNTGGAETFIMKIYRNIDRRRYQFDFIVASSKRGFYEDEIEDKGGKIYHIPLHTKHPFKSFFEIKRIIKQNRYDRVLKFCDTPLGITDLVAAKMGGAKIVAVRSCNAGSGSNTAKECVYNIIRPFFNRLAMIKIAPSKLAAEYTFGEKAALSEVKYIHNGIDLEYYKYNENARSVIRESLGIKNNQFVIGHVGRLNQQKNHKYLMDVFAEIHDKIDSMLLIVGDGELKESLTKYAEEKGIGNKTVFAGVQSDIPAFLSAMDVFVFPSLYEGMPNTVIEAQGTGLPCFVSDTITREANITDLVQYCSITAPPASWVEQIIKCNGLPRRNTSEQVRRSGYDINETSKEFVSLLMK